MAEVDTGAGAGEDSRVDTSTPVAVPEHAMTSAQAVALLERSLAEHRDEVRSGRVPSAGVSVSRCRAVLDHLAYGGRNSHGYRGAKDRATFEHVAARLSLIHAERDWPEVGAEDATGRPGLRLR